MENASCSQLCIFEFVYFARPDSVIDGASVHKARVEAGKMLAIEHPVDADIVIGAPDGGLNAALGYSRQSGIPYGQGLLKNRYLNTLVIIFFALYLALGGQAIWPIFGASNQLVAALVLIVITAYLFSRGKNIKYTLYPAIFVLFTTIGALIYKILEFIDARKYLLTVMASILFFLAVFLLFEGYSMVERRKMARSKR